MLFSLALVFLLGFLLGGVFKKIHLPPLLGMLITGIILGPFVLDLLDGKLLAISAELRQIALVIILTRAGLALDFADLKKVGRPAILLCFVPAVLEIIGMAIFAPLIFGVTVLEGVIMGCVVAAVSPAVIVPKMLHLMDTDYGKSKKIPQMIMAAASVDDVIVIVLFTAFTTLAVSGNFSAAAFLDIPVSIILGVIVGVVVGLLLSVVYKKTAMSTSVKVLISLSVSFILLAVETLLKGTLGFSGLLAVMTVGITLKGKNTDLAAELSGDFSKLWVGAEVLLFVLVGATVDISYAVNAGIWAIILIFICLIFRVVGVLISTYKTNLTVKERLFCSVAYLPKATVQAAIGALPLSMGLACGNLVLTVAVIAILVTAPLGAFLIDLTYKKLLK